MKRIESVATDDVLKNSQMLWYIWESFLSCKGGIVFGQQIDTVLVHALES